MAGGAGSVFGPGTAGSIGAFGNQFPSQNDKAYNPGDLRIATVLGARRGARRGTKRKKKNKQKIPVQRRALPGL